MDKIKKFFEVDWNGNKKILHINTILSIIMALIYILMYICSDNNIIWRIITLYIIFLAASNFVYEVSIKIREKKIDDFRLTYHRNPYISEIDIFSFLLIRISYFPFILLVWMVEKISTIEKIRRFQMWFVPFVVSLVLGIILFMAIVILGWGAILNCFGTRAQDYTTAIANGTIIICGIFYFFVTRGIIYLLLKYKKDKIKITFGELVKDVSRIEALICILSIIVMGLLPNRFQNELISAMDKLGSIYAWFITLQSFNEKKHIETKKIVLKEKLDN